MTKKYQRPVLIQVFQKGRGLSDLLARFEPLFFPNREGIAQAIIHFLEQSKSEIKEKPDNRGSNKNRIRDELFDKIAEYARTTGLNNVFKVEPDYMRDGQPDRIVFGSIDTVIDGGIPLRIIGDLNPFTNCRNNLVPIAITNSDQVADKLLRESGNSYPVNYVANGAVDPQMILDMIRRGGIDTTVKYGGSLKISESRTMMFASISPGELNNMKYDETGRPKLDKNTKLYIDGQQWFLMKSVFGVRKDQDGKPTFIEDKDVDYTVFRAPGRWGAYIVSTGSSLRKKAESGSPLSVVRTPLFTSSGALFFNPVGDERKIAANVVGLIREFNGQLSPPSTYQEMCQNLSNYLVGPSK